MGKSGRRPSSDGDNREMVLDRLRQTAGGGAGVTVVLADPVVRPGQSLRGELRLAGGNDPVDLTGVAVGLVARVEVTSGDAEYDTMQEFHTQDVTGHIALAPGARQELPFRLDLPWETPLTHLAARPLPGIALAVRATLRVPYAPDPHHQTALTVRPLPAQQQVVDELGRAGFHIVRSDLERGHLYGVHQQLPFYQEMELRPTRNHPGGVRHLELTFVTDAWRVEVLLQADRRGGAFGGPGDPFHRFAVPHPGADRGTTAGGGQDAAAVGGQERAGGRRADWHDDLHTWLTRTLRRA